MGARIRPGTSLIHSARRVEDKGESAKAPDQKDSSHWLRSVVTEYAADVQSCSHVPGRLGIRYLEIVESLSNRKPGLFVMSGWISGTGWIRKQRRSVASDHSRAIL